MPQNVTDVSTFTAPIVAVADGDPADGADFLAATQGLSNRTRYLKTILNTGQVPGSDGTAAATAGNLGESFYISRPFSNELVILAGNTANVCNVSTDHLALTAGDWEISALCNVTLGTAGSGVFIGISNATASLSGVGPGPPDSTGRILNNINAYGTSTGVVAAFPSFPLRISSTLSLYLVASNTTAATMAVSGFIHARRIR